MWLNLGLDFSFHGPTTKSHKRSNRTKRAGPRELMALVTAAVAACTGCHGHLFLSLSVGD